MSETSEIASLVELSHMSPVTIEAPEGRTFIARPNNFVLEQITSPNKADVLMPKTVVASVKLQSTESMIDYTNRFKNLNTVLFADIDRDTIVSIIDYHTESAVTEDGIKPKLTTHRATLTLPKSQEWKTWTGASDKLMSHRDFASFLEENSIDIVEPVGADLLELCRDLQVVNNVNFSSAVRDGDYTSVAYAKENDATAKGSIRLPQSIILSIPVYFGEQPVLVTAFLRKKIDDDGLKLGVKLARVENVRQAEFHRIVEQITIHVNHLTTVYGTPA
jgi:uncharacterized protein YfdQ (DUF2303 family)